MSHVAPTNYGGGEPMNAVVAQAQQAQDAARNAPIVVVGPDGYDMVGLTASEALARWDERRISEIKRQIAAGTYLTEEKVSLAVDRLYEALREAAAERQSMAV